MYGLCTGIHIYARAPGHFVQVQVKGQGPGIKAAHGPGSACTFLQVGSWVSGWGRLQGRIQGCRAPHKLRLSDVRAVRV